MPATDITIMTETFMLFFFYPLANTAPLIHLFYWKTLRTSDARFVVGEYGGPTNVDAAPVLGVDGTCHPRESTRQRQSQVR